MTPGLLPKAACPWPRSPEVPCSLAFGSAVLFPE